MSSRPRRSSRRSRTAVTAAAGAGDLTPKAERGTPATTAASGSSAGASGLDSPAAPPRGIVARPSSSSVDSATDIMSGLQDDDLFNFVLVNADHITNGSDTSLGLGFIDDPAAAAGAAAAAAATAGTALAASAAGYAGAASLQPSPPTVSFDTSTSGPVALLDPTDAAPLAFPVTGGATGAGGRTTTRGRSVKRSAPGSGSRDASGGGAGAPAGSGSGSGSGSGAGAGAGPPLPTKRRKRLEKNRESARECRRRKKEHLEVLETRVKRLEQEAAVLRERLRATRADAVKEEVEEKRAARKEMRQRLERGATDEELAGVIAAYREKFSDYGARRQTAVQYHLDQLERLLKPTQVTRMGMWCLHQDDSFYQENSLDPEGGTTMWHFLCNELKVTEEQQRKIKQYRTKVRDLSEGLRNTMDLLEELRGRAQVKNVALDQAMHDLQGILTPTQSAKFILWVDSNPVCMQMLNSLWSVLPKT